MEVGMQMIFASHGYDGVSDAQVYDEEIQLGLLAEELGFGSLWPVEHHFYDYSFCPDNLQMLSYLAARTERIELATGAVILPWNEPLRVAEKVAMLDHLSNGRVRLGFGRGLSRREYSHFRGIEMDEARGRFDEASLMIQEALETGFIEGDGEFYPQPRTEIRPRPTRTFKDRTYAIAGSANRFGARRSWRVLQILLMAEPLPTVVNNPQKNKENSQTNRKMQDAIRVHVDRRHFAEQHGMNTQEVGHSTEHSNNFDNGKHDCHQIVNAENPPDVVHGIHPIKVWHQPSEIHRGPDMR